MAKSYAIARPLAGPPMPQAWWSYHLNNGGSPVVIKRKLGYVVTALSELARWETVLKQELARSADERHPDAIQNLNRRIANANDWANYSIQVLRNCVRFALARITDGPDAEEMRSKRLETAEREISLLPADEAKVARLIFQGGGYRRVASELSISDADAREMIDRVKGKIRVAPLLRASGRRNKKWHDELRYYAQVLDSYLLAKEAVSGTSRSDAAMAILWRDLSKVVSFHKSKSGREMDDAEQQAALGLLAACREFLPGKDGKFAQLPTFAQWKIRRETQVRKNSQFRPGLTTIGGKLKATKSLDIHDESGRADQYHPEGVEDNNVVVNDVASALATLSEDERALVESALIRGESIAKISAATGDSVQRIRTKLAELKERLGEMLKSHQED
jgi:RNA polymerase sigma factor (sigma-70 family)